MTMAVPDIAVLDVATPVSAHSGVVVSNNRCYNNCKIGSLPGNRCHHNGNAANGQTLSDIGVNNCVDSTIIGNQSYNFGSATISARGLYAGSNARGVGFVGNQVINVGQGTTTGVGLYVDSANLLFAGSNYFYDEPDDPMANSMAFCISGSAGLRNAYIGNFCDTAPVNIFLQPDTAFSNAIQGTLVMRNLATAAAGLTTGGVWRNGTVLNIV